MHGFRLYITPEDVMDRLSEEDKERFNRCIFTDVVKEMDGSVSFGCVLVNDIDTHVEENYRQRFFGDDPIEVYTAE